MTTTHRFYFTTSSTTDAASNELREKYGAKVRIRISTERRAFEVLATPGEPFKRVKGAPFAVSSFDELAARHKGEYAGTV